MKLSEACIETGYSKLFNTVLCGDICWPEIWRAASIYNLILTSLSFIWASFWLPTLQRWTDSFGLISCNSSVISGPFFFCWGGGVIWLINTLDHLSMCHTVLLLVPPQWHLLAQFGYDYIFIMLSCEAIPSKATYYTRLSITVINTEDFGEILTQSRQEKHWAC